MPSRPSRPNILLLFTDQHTADVLGCAGHADVATPHLDALAARGVRLRRAYCPSGICVPSRAALFAGRHSRSVGVLDNRTLGHWREASLTTTLARAGYRCAAFGKRHLRPVGEALDAGWHEVAACQHVESPHDSYVGWIEGRGLLDAFASDWAAEFGCGPDGSRLAQERRPIALLAARPTALPEDATMEAWVAQRTVDFLRRQRGAAQPFFCFTSFYRPHQPYTAHPRWLADYPHLAWGPGRREGGAIRMPATLRQDPADLPPVFQEWHRGSNRVWRLDLARQDEQLYRDYVAGYYALVSEIDNHIGTVLATLDELGMREDTIVIYTTDHGDFVGNHAMVEKCASGHNVYEDILRVPLILDWGGRFGAGREADDLVSLIDLYPTLTALTGTPPPVALDGCDLGPLLMTGQRLPREFLVSENRWQTTIITDRCKLGRWNTEDVPGREVLFDRIADPLELHDQSAVQPAETARLRALLAGWERATVDGRPAASGQAGGFF